MWTALPGKHYFSLQRFVAAVICPPVDAEHMSAGLDAVRRSDPYHVNALYARGAWRLSLIFGGDRVVHHVSLRLPNSNLIMREIPPKQGEGGRHKLGNIVLLSGEPL